MELEPVRTEEPERMVLGSEMLAVVNLRSFLVAMEADETLIDPDVTQSIEAARQALGAEGQIQVLISADDDEHKVVIDESRVQEIAGRRPRQQELVAMVSGLLTMVDIEPPFRVAIRSANGMKWNCRYPQELEGEVSSLLKHQVAATGSGVLVNSRRGYFEIDTLEEVKEFEQTPLFSVERRAMEALLQEQSITRPQGWDAFADPDWPDEDDDGVYIQTQVGEG
jgi:hypothetical protein